MQGRRLTLQALIAPSSVAVYHGAIHPSAPLRCPSTFTLPRPVYRTGQLASFDMVEVNPALQVNDTDVGEDTVQLALALTASALGNTIL